MARYLGPVCKQCKREGEKLFLKGKRCYEKCPIGEKAQKPGQHGASGGRSKSSEYSVRLREKQKAKRIAGLNETQFYHYFTMASKMKGLSGNNLIQLLTRRLDCVVQLMGISSSRKGARQLIGHGHVTVNGKKIDLPGYLVKVGDKISFSDKLASNKNIPVTQGDVSHPKWLDFDKNSKLGTVLSAPTKEESPYSTINEQYIVELYSK